jgi:hypothetical protein
MGEIQHGTYDDECEGLTYEEINALYGFGTNGDPEIGEEEEASDDESRADFDSDNETDRMEIDSDHELNSDIEACLFVQSSDH